jgi:predicted phosphodiesterase
VAVRGNIDKRPPSSELPARATVEAGPARILVLHDVHEMDLDPAAAAFRAVVSGHSHKASTAERNGVLFINPGSAGPRRFRLPVTVGRLQIPEFAVRIIELA